MPSLAPRRFVPVLLAISVISTAPRPMRADTILTFAPACTGSVTLHRGAYYAESGFQITSAELGSWCSGQAELFAGTGAFINDFHGGATLSAVNNSAFSIASIDLANLFYFETGVGPLTFTGHLFGGGIVTQTFNFSLAQTTPPVFSTFSFNAAFTNLVSLDLAPQGDNSLTEGLYQFTNVHLTATSVAPEPASFLLMATGFVGLGIAARHRKRRSLGPAR